MRFSSFVVACGIAASASAAPLYSLPLLLSNAYDLMSGHCNVSQIAQPPSAIPAPAPGLKVAVVMIGRGTQNYTCPAVNDATAVPAAIGAVANLYDFSCMAAHTSADRLGNLTAAVESVPRSDRLLKALPVAARHYFPDSTTPTFAFDNKLGTVQAKKLNATAAPASAQNAVPWLKLQAVPGQASPVQQIYRLETANGAAPAACGDKTGIFTVEYAAEYWFYVPESFQW